jgi:ubiquinone/menaquinone biosynthesis C-methylase UbiE
MTGKDQTHKVQSFFDNIAADYPGRYESPFLKFFYTERLIAATAGFNFEGKSILDIGAGTCALYHFLKKDGKSFKYYASDLSKEMLNQCKLPEEQLFHGQLEEQNFPVDKFDFIYMLGVSNYMPPEELKNTLVWIQNHLSPTGRAIVSFTHKNSIDYQMIYLLKNPLRALGFKKKGVAQDFKSYAYSPKELRSILPEKLVIERLHWLNYSIFPFNRLFTGLAVGLAKWWQRRGREMPLFSSDFLIVAKDGEGRKEHKEIVLS